MTDKLFNRLIAAMHAENLFDTQVDQLCENMTNTSGMPASIANAFKTAFLEVFTMDTFNEVFKKELGARFSNKELENLIEFFESGVGQRWAEESGDMMVKLNDQIQKIVRERMPLVQEIFERQLNAAM